MSRLKRIKVPINNLYLDPNNPRLIQQLEDIKHVSDRDIKGYQNKLLQNFDISGKKKEVDGFFDTEDLANGIKEVGLLPGNVIAVRKIKDSDKYLVIEGNRRISTLKHLLLNFENNPGDKTHKLEPHVKNSLEMVAVKVIEDGAGQEKMVKDILITRHGAQRQLSWGPYETALYIQEKYLSRIIDNIGPLEIDNFEFNQKRAKETAKLCSKNDKEIKDALVTAMVYRQIQTDRQNEKIKPTDYSLLKAVVTNGKLRANYLELDRKSFKLDDMSCERVETICQFGKRDDPNKILKDDKAVNRFADLVKATNNSDEALGDYAKRLLNEVVQEETPLDIANAYYKERAASREFIERLENHLIKRKERSHEGEALSYEKFGVEGDDRLALDQLLNETPSIEWLEFFKR